MKRIFAIWIGVGLAFGAQAQGLYGYQTHGGDIPPPYDPMFHHAQVVRATNPPPGQLAAVLPQLTKRAQAGDMLAAKALFMGLQQCQAEQQYQDSGLFQKQCAGITPAQIATDGKWLTQAASAGDEEARYIYAMSPFIYGFPDKNDPAAVATYKSTARYYLLSMAAQCNLDAAFHIAGDAVGTPFLFGSDLKDAYKFALVVELISRPDAAHGALVRDAQRMQQAIAAKLGPSADIAGLRQDAGRFVDHTCR